MNQQPIVFVSKFPGSNLFVITRTGTKEAPGPTFRNQTHDEAIDVVADFLSDGITNISDPHGILSDAYNRAHEVCSNDPACFNCSKEWQHLVDLGDDYREAYPHGRIPLCKECKEEVGVTV